MVQIIVWRTTSSIENKIYIFFLLMPFDIIKDSLNGNKLLVVLHNQFNIELHWSRII